MRAIQVIIEVLFWMVAAVAALVCAGMVFGLIFAPLIGYLAAGALIGLMPLILGVIRLIRRRRAVMILGYLEQAVRLNLPLPAMLRAAQQSEHGVLALRLAQLRQLLEEGYPLAAGIESALSELGDREACAIASAERMGRLPQALRGLLNEQSRVLSTAVSGDERLVNSAFYSTYPLLMLAALAGCTTVFAVYVLPKYQQMFKDHQLVLPGITLRTMALAESIGPTVIVVVAAIVVIVAAASVAQMLHPMRFGRSTLRRVRDFLAWMTPLLHGIERDRGLADAFDVIAGALAAGVPADRAVGEVTRLGINSVLRRRFRAWAAALEGGASLSDGARTAGMPGIVAGMLRGVEATAAAAEVFDFLARYYHSRFSRGAATLEGAGIPLLVFFFACLVAVLAISFFAPMISIIHALTPTVGGL